MTFLHLCITPSSYRLRVVAFLRRIHIAAERERLYFCRCVAAHAALRSPTPAVCLHSFTPAVTTSLRVRVCRFVYALVTPRALPAHAAADALPNIRFRLVNTSFELPLYLRFGLRWCAAPVCLSR